MIAGTTVLVVEDETPMRRFLRAALASQGLEVLEAASCAEAARVAAEHRPQAVLLDLGLPDGDGLSVLRALREWSPAPVIVLSARDRENDKVVALDAGADDYLTKPFGTHELFARLRVALRNARRQAAPAPSPLLEFGPLQLDLARHEVRVDGELRHLTPLEFRLLAELARHVGKVLTHRHLLQEVWGAEHVEQTQYLRVHMAALRRKLEADPARPRWLTTEPGVGYRLRDGAGR